MCEKGHDESDPIFYDLEPAVCTKNDEIKPNSKLKYDLIHVRVCRRIWYLDTQWNLAKHYIAHQVYMYDLQIKSIVKYTYLWCCIV